MCAVLQGPYCYVYRKLCCQCTTTRFVATRLQSRTGHMIPSFIEAYYTISSTKMLLYYGFMRAILTYELNPPDYAVLWPCMGGYKYL